MKTNNRFQVRYRSDSGYWYPLQTFATKKEAQQYADNSQTCQMQGYQIVKVK